MNNETYSEEYTEPQDHDNQWSPDDTTDSAGSDADSNNIAHYVEPLVRVTLRMPEKNKHQLMHWSHVQGMSMSEYVIRAIENQIDRDNGRFDGETMMSARMAEMTDAIEGFARVQSNYGVILSQILHAFTTLMTGDTVLTDIDEEDDGELL